jgi:hypothetical protein
MFDDFTPFERQAHRRFSLRSRCGGLQLRMRMSLRDLLCFIIIVRFFFLEQASTGIFFKLQCVGRNRLSFSATG